MRSPASLGNGVQIRLADSRSVTVKGRGPGQLSGPAVAYTLRLANQSASVIDLTDAVVTLTYGAGTPASDSTAKPAHPWSGRVARGATATGTYVFLVPPAERSRVRMQVSYQPTAPVLVLTAGR